MSMGPKPVFQHGGAGNEARPRQTVIVQPDIVQQGLFPMPAADEVVASKGLINPTV